MSDGGTIVDWGVAERVAFTLLAGIPGRTAHPGPSYTAAEVERACEEAVEASAAYIGLGRVHAPPRAELVDRREWTRGALRTLADAATPLERRAASELGLSGPVGSLLRRAMGAAVGTEAGVAAGFAGRRVLGQYDVSLFGEERPARLLFVAENMASARHDLDADPVLFLRWIALHECTHVVQFDRVPWLTGHLRAMVGELIDGASEAISGGSIPSAARQLLRNPGEVARSLLRGELAQLLASPEQRAQLDRAQAAMSVIEGHAEHVMDACAREHDPRLLALRERLDARRAHRSALSEIVGRLLGMDLKLRQYELGRRFFEIIVAAGGEDAARLPWRSPADLPTLDELEHPGAWLARVGPVAAPA